jgi:hypothetical protein
MTYIKRRLTGNPSFFAIRISLHIKASKPQNMMGDRIRLLGLSAIALLFSAIGFLSPGAAFAHDRDDYRDGYERGYRRGYWVGYREAENGDEYSNHFPDGYDSYSVGFHDGQHAGYDRGYREGRRRWHYHQGW